MPYTKNQKVLYTSLTGKKENAIILLRKQDYKEGYINSDFAKGNFDYLIEVTRNGKLEKIFCMEDELEQLF